MVAALSFAKQTLKTKEFSDCFDCFAPFFKEILILSTSGGEGQWTRRKAAGSGQAIGVKE
jgi:hypothetical protein